MSLIAVPVVKVQMERYFFRALLLGQPEILRMEVKAVFHESLRQLLDACWAMRDEG
jgi:hypothetical protein